MTLILCLIIWMISITNTTTKCAFSVTKDKSPFFYNGNEFPINFTMQSCQEYVGGNVCCNQYNDMLTAANFIQVDGAFASDSGGCDICAINLKRFWCQFICSPKQADFLTVSKEFYQYPDPQKPGATIMAQQANLTVEASTACALYDTCKRLPFVSSVSAMGSPAGFLNFQGHNGIDNSHQYINVLFTNDKSKGLYFGNDTKEEKTAQMTACNYKGQDLHGFEVKEICSCNTCEDACDTSIGFKYTEPSIFQGFNTVLVLLTYSVVALTSILITYFRYWRAKNKRRE